ncbi:Purine nucleoside phosphorylase [Cardiosporidium cionae]|uniref:Purine nucleoside phosphorylase n=1 Tax=Cardiosporidium cionae TaxID=476202 RepID=A0ABQ7J429_9APIC|nr:Purine nucleoside phosphorylase [Cardiosporidium cionae]|eukprot:KAF8817848.1 Purine nucleoside phosphorylase [Cardiosporidium cionae]
MEGCEVQPHIRLRKDQVHPVALVVGDPARALQIAKMSDIYTELSYNREYRSFDCSVSGVRFTVLSHGVGSSGAAVALEELIWCGAKAIIRAGTAGSLQQHIKTGDLTVSYAAAREEGVTALMVPLNYPAAASPEVYQALTTSANELNTKYHSGICVTSDLFYKPKVLPSSLEMYSKANVQIVSMEESILFIQGTLNNVLTGAIHVVDGSPLKWDEADYDPTGEKVSAGKKMMIQICFSAVKKLAKLLQERQSATSN